MCYLPDTGLVLQGWGTKPGSLPSWSLEGKQKGKEFKSCSFWEVIKSLQKIVGLMLVRTGLVRNASLRRDVDQVWPEPVLGRIHMSTVLSAVPSVLRSFFLHMLPCAMSLSSSVLEVRCHSTFTKEKAESATESNPKVIEWISARLGSGSDSGATLTWLASLRGKDAWQGLPCGRISLDPGCQARLWTC